MSMIVTTGINAGRSHGTRVVGRSISHCKRFSKEVSSNLGIPYIQKRSMHSTGTHGSSRRKVMVVTGATGQMGPGLIEKAVESGFHISACTRNPAKWQPTPYVSYVATPEEEITKAKFWQDFLEEQTDAFDEAVVVNLIGAADAPAGKTLEDINRKPVIAAMEATVKVKDKSGKRFVFQHLSSTCASLVESHPYAVLRRVVDEELKQIAQENGISFTAYRPGLIFNDLRLGKMVDMGHKYSPEQLATLPIHPVLGTGNQFQQPVYQGDLFEAIVNASAVDHQEIIDALGPDVITQKEMFEFFAKLSGRKFKPVSIPYGLAKVIAEHFPMGRISAYSIAAFQELEQEHKNKPLCDKAFIQLVGRPTLGMKDVYLCNDESGEPIVLARPPVVEHIQAIAAKLLRCPKARRELAWAMASDGGELTRNIIRSQLEGIFGIQK